MSCVPEDFKPLKKLETVLNSKTHPFKEKVECLIKAWKHVASYSSGADVTYIVQLLDWVRLHTLNIVLTGEWKKFKDLYGDSLIHELLETEKALVTLNTIFSHRCKKLTEVVQDPWGNPVLHRLLNTPDANIGPEEIEFFSVETGYLVAMRLKKLCESHCEDLALNLVTAFIRCYRLAEIRQFNLNATEKQKWFIFDIYIALLYRFKKIPLIISTLKNLSLHEGFEFCNRFNNKRVTICKIWKHSHRVAQLACQVFITALVMKPCQDVAKLLPEFLKIWFSVCNKQELPFEALTSAIRKLIQTAESGVQMHIFCETVLQMFGPEIRTFSVELFIRTLTADLNDLERRKLENDAENTGKVTSRLAQGLDQLGDLLKNVNVSRECVLTAFSLQPTEKRLKRIEELARKSGFVVLDTGQTWKCKLYPPALETDEITFICDSCGGYHSLPQLDIPINTTNTALSEALNAEELGITDQLRDDLVVLLSGPRYQVFSWLLPWDELHRLCLMYLEDPERTKNIVPELKYLDIDYSIFKRIKNEPVDDELTGIEKGYEHCYNLINGTEEDDEQMYFDDIPQEDELPFIENADLFSYTPSESNADVMKLKQYLPGMKRSSEEDEEENSPNVVTMSRCVTPDSPRMPSTPRSRIDEMEEVNNIISERDSCYSPISDISVEVSVRTEQSTLDVLKDVSTLLSLCPIPKSPPTKTANVPIPLEVPLPRTPLRQSLSLESSDSESCVVNRKHQVLSDSEEEVTSTSSHQSVSQEQKMSWTGDWVKSSRYNEESMHSKKTKSKKKVRRGKTMYDSTISQKENCENLKEKYNIRESTVLLERVERDVIERYKRSEGRERLRETNENCNVVEYPFLKINIPKSESGKHSVQDLRKLIKSKYPIVLLERVDLQRQLQRYKQLAEKRVKAASSRWKQAGLANYRIPKRTNLSGERSVSEVLSSVPGLRDLELIRPNSTNQIVQVVQISGARPGTNVPQQNTQTSTQITPHIQRIGQPRGDKPEQTNASVPPTTTATTTQTTPSKPVSSQHSTLVSMLSQHQQIVRPSSGGRRPPLINILSQQIIKPGNSSIKQQQPTNQQSNSAVRSNSEQTQVVTSQGVGARSSSPNAAKSSRIVKAPSQAGSSESPPSPNYENFKCNKSPPKAKADAKENADSLPKFQQAFGKPVYQNNLETATTTATTETSTDEKKLVRTTSVCVQPVQGSVIYTRQMPVGQAINILPPCRGQVFRISSTGSDPNVFRGKMTAFLAAALQGKPKGAEVSEGDSANSEDNTVTVTCPTLVQTGRIIKPVLQIPLNVTTRDPLQANVSSTTLEQLREFDMVYNKVKERSSTSSSSESGPSPESNNENSQQHRISVTYVNQGQKFSQLSPVVVVSSYCSFQSSASSPALSVTSQGSSSPCVTPAPSSASNPKVSSKNSKGKVVKSTVTSTSKSSPIPKPQQKPQEDEHTTQRIFDILAEYAEQLRNSPDLNNKPAPRRRSNPPTNPNPSAKRKKSSSSKKTQCNSGLPAEADVDDQRTMGSEDSSCGLVQLSVQDDDQPSTPVNTTESTSDSTTVTSCPQLILSETPSAQTRPLIIADSSVSELKMPSTAVLMPANYVMPVAMVKGGQQIAVVSGASKILATVPRTGPNMVLFQSIVNQKSGSISGVKYSAISGISSQQIAGMNAQPPVILPSTVALGQPITLKKVTESREMLVISHTNYANVTTNNEDSKIENNKLAIQEGTEKKEEIEKPTTQTTVLKPNAQVKETKETETVITVDVSVGTQETNKSVLKAERVQTVLVTASTSNGPMLAHNPPNYSKSVTQTTIVTQPRKDGCIRKVTSMTLPRPIRNKSDQKSVQNNTVFVSKNKKPTSNRPDLQQLSLQRKQAALERELRLQKSLSEECEDLGVDEPSTSELFPEADLLFDSNHSPSFEAHHEIKRPANQQEQQPKEESKPAAVTLFTDEEPPSSARSAAFLFESSEYPKQLTNGQTTTSGGNNSCCTENCAAAATEVTAADSPVSPEPPYLTEGANGNKYKYKYTNRKKLERHKPAESWSSSEDTSSELHKGGLSPDMCAAARQGGCEDAEGHRVSYSAHEGSEDDEDMGRGARKSVKKKCSCCNGSQEGGAHHGRKRPASRPTTPAPHKKNFSSKKR